MRIVSLVLVVLLGATACGGKSKAPAAQPEPEMMENEGGDTYGSTGGGYEDDKEPCDEEGSE